MKPNAMHWLCGLLVILSTFACTITGQVGFHNLLPVHTLFYGLATPFFIGWFGKFRHNAPFPLKALAGILALLFSQFVTVGGSFYVVHSWALCFGDWRAVLVWLFRSFVYGYVFYQILLGILCVLNSYQASSEASYHLNYRRWFMLIVAVRLIVLFFFYPCVFGFDAAVGLRTYMDPDCATCNHHPFFIQFIHGLFFSIGKGFGHLSVGMALLSLLSILFSSTILIYGLHLLKLSRLSRRWLLVIASLYAFFPLYPYLSVNPTKDGLFAYAFLLYLLTLYELAITQGTNQLSSRYLVLHNLAILLVCLTRHQGIYLVVFECVMLLFYYRSFWKSLLFAFIPSLCLILTYNHLLLPYYNVEPGGKQEVYGTLFQQTALYLKRYPKDVTPDEQASINNVLNCETMVAKYVFDKTDGVKNDYKYNPWYRPYVGAPSMFRHIDHTNETNDLKAYRSAWLSMGIRHPLVYIEATLAVTAGFFYNFNRLILETSPNWAANPAAITPEFHFAHFNTTARIYNRRIYSWFKYPVINWVIAIPYYNWIAIILLALLFYRKDVRGLIIFLPVLLSIGILLICPMIYGRYSYPIVISLPLLLAYIISSKDFRKSIN